MAYITHKQDNLPIYGISKAKNLTEYCTTEKDNNRGISRIPMLLARIYDEDIKLDETKPKYIPTSPKSHGDQALQSREEMFENFENTVNNRSSKLLDSMNSSVFELAVEESE